MYRSQFVVEFKSQMSVETSMGEYEPNKFNDGMSQLFELYQKSPPSEVSMTRSSQGNYYADWYLYLIYGFPERFQKKFIEHMFKNHRRLDNLRGHPFDPDPCLYYVSKLMYRIWEENQDERHTNFQPPDFYFQNTAAMSAKLRLWANEADRTKKTFDQHARTICNDIATKAHEAGHNSDSDSD